MKLINYKYGYYNTFGCSIHGKIIMTQKEWQNAYKYLTSSNVKKSFLPSYPHYNSLITEDIKRQVKTKDGYLINIRVPMTEKLVNHYNIPRYKRGNYMLLITK